MLVLLEEIAPRGRAELQARFLHQAHDPFAADMRVLLEEILVDARTPVALFALGEGRPHQHSQSTGVARMRRFRARARRIEAAGRDVQRPTTSRDRELGLLRRNPGKRHAWCLAKKARQVQSVNATAVAVYQLAWHIPASCVDVS